MSNNNTSFACTVCHEDGKYVLHTATINHFEEDGTWTWAVLNHDQSVKMEYPIRFDTKDDAMTDLKKIMASVGEGNDIV